MLLLSTLAAAVFAQASPPAPLALSPSAPGGCVVLVSRSEGLTPQEATRVALRVANALRAAGVPVPLTPQQVQEQVGDPLRACAGEPSCLARLGRGLGAGAVAEVDVAKIFGDLSYELALLDAATGQSLADKVFAAPADSALVDAELAEFSRTTRYALLTLPAFTPRPDAPRAVSLAPRTTPPSAQALSGRPVPVAAYASAGGAVVAGVTAAVFGALTYEMWSRTVPDAQQRISLRESELPAYGRNQLVTGIAGGACAALTGAAIYLWLNPPSAPSASR